jgi:hypothetical protein
VGTIQIERERSQPERSLFRAKINSDYNDFVARVALEVVDGWWETSTAGKKCGQQSNCRLIE